jgi:pSer/pThr/pTyr-binding forkhead associated (FHA) protein
MQAEMEFAMKAFLIVQIPGPMHGKKIPITGAAFTIGRDPKCSLEASNPALAEQHCALTIRQGQLFVRDLETDTGTLVNDVRINGEIRVREGDRVKVGPLLFRISIEIAKPTARKQVEKPVKPKPKPPDDNCASYAAKKLLLEYMRGKRK